MQKKIGIASNAPFIKGPLPARAARPVLLLLLLGLAGAGLLDAVGAGTPPAIAQQNATGSDTEGAHAPAASFRYDAYARLLGRFLTEDGRVRYAELQADPSDLNSFLEQLAAASPESHPGLFPAEEAQMAYWINAYNAFTLKGVVDRYPLKSIISLRTLYGQRFFKPRRYTAGGRKISLNDIEHEILRQRFREPRIHFALNCASASCPPLRREPYLPATLDRQLEESARLYMHSSEGFQWKKGKLYLSALFKWYKDDFLKSLAPDGEEIPTVADYAAQYLPEEDARRVRAERPKVKFLKYNWSLNDVPRNDAAHKK